MRRWLTSILLSSSLLSISVGQANEMMMEDPGNTPSGDLSAPGSLSFDGEFYARTEADAGLSLTPETAAAARFLTQATFGPTALEINQLASSLQALSEQEVYATWLDLQFATPASSLHSRLPEEDPKHANIPMWWQHSLTAPDQLRQRVGFALSQILTVSRKGPLRKDATLADYYDTLARGAFGNFRTLLGDVTYHPGMGVYLDNHNNFVRRGQTHVNENYARELMQLFTLGTEMLNADGSAILDADDQPIAPYSEADVENLARALSGMSRGGRWLGPMKIRWRKHDRQDKVLFAGTAQEVLLPARRQPVPDITESLDALFNHPNIGPFIGRQLIQHLVTSNPSPAYVARISAVFANNGSGVRGDLQAVVSAILLDDEARNGQHDERLTFGKLKAPVLRLSNLMRGFAFQPHWKRLGKGLNGIQTPLYASTVFSFFQPDDSPAGPLRDAGLVAPEFKIADDRQLVSLHNFMRKLTLASYGRRELRRNLNQELDLSRESALAASNIDALLDRYALLFMGGEMSDEMRSTLRDYLAGVPVDDGGLQRAREALYLVMTSSEQAIQR